MAAVTYVCTFDYVAKMLCEDVELLETIIANDDNLTDGNIVSVYDGMEELKDMIRAARITAKTWHKFLHDFVDDADLVSLIKAQSLR
ncbi:MAG: hypothetical protein ABJL99_16350 [Aliishimia sp.]